MSSGENRRDPYTVHTRPQTSLYPILFHIRDQLAASRQQKEAQNYQNNNDGSSSSESKVKAEGQSGKRDDGGNAISGLMKRPSLIGDYFGWGD